MRLLTRILEELNEKLKDKSNLSYREKRSWKDIKNALTESEGEKRE